MQDFSKKVMESGKALNALLVLGFLGIVWLIIYGNLSGNLGFSQDSSNFFNETITLSDAGATPAGASGRVNGAISNILMTNATGGEIISSANYSVSGVLISNITVQYGGVDVNVSYLVAYDSQGLINTEGVIANLTSGVNTFFGFSGTWFTILAIVLLIVILIGLLYIVMKIADMNKDNKKGGYSGY